MSLPTTSPRVMDGMVDTRAVFGPAVGVAGRVFVETMPQWLTVGGMLFLIFGGCCSNVFALESIIKVEPASGQCSRARCQGHKT